MFGIWRKHSVHYLNLSPSSLLAVATSYSPASYIWRSFQTWPTNNASPCSFRDSWKEHRSGQQRYGARGRLTADFEAFLQQFWDVFDHSNQRQSSAQHLSRLWHGRALMVDYSISFRILTANSISNKAALLTRFRDGLNETIQLELMCRDKGLDLSDCVTLAIRLDQHFHGQGRLPQPASQSRRLGFREPSSLMENPIQSPLEQGLAEEAMELSSSRLCLHYGSTGHGVAQTPRRGRTSACKTSQVIKCCVSAKLHVSNRYVSVFPLVEMKLPADTE